MARRVPGVRLLMEQAALDLYESQGLAATTATQIAATAGVTERTFFRHFGDKLEAVFGDETRLRTLVGDAIVAAPAPGTAWACVQDGLRLLATEFDARSDALRRRARVVAANPELQERELGRSAAWVQVLTAALGERGVTMRAAQTAAATGLVLFRLALERWKDEPDTTFVDQLDSAFRDHDAMSS